MLNGVRREKKDNSGAALRWAGAAAILAVALGGSAMAHEAKSGWNYPISCCSGYDCRAVAETRISEKADGYHVPSGEVIAYSDKRVRISEDGEYHWCSVGGRDNSSTICLFVPPRFF